MKLNHRNWVIIDANGKIMNVQGEGVVGEFPTLQPGESFEYTSGTPLKTTNGIMQGFYLMSQDNGEQLKIDIPAFLLIALITKKLSLIIKTNVQYQTHCLGRWYSRLCSWIFAFYSFNY